MTQIEAVKSTAIAMQKRAALASHKSREWRNHKKGAATSIEYSQIASEYYAEARAWLALIDKEFPND